MTTGGSLIRRRESVVFYRARLCAFLPREAQLVSMYAEARITRCYMIEAGAPYNEESLCVGVSVDHRSPFATQHCLGRAPHFSRAEIERGGRLCQILT